MIASYGHAGAGIGKAQCVQGRVDRIGSEDIDQGTPPIIESESREPPVDWGDESSGPPLSSRSELSGEDIGRKLGLQLKKVFGEGSDAVVKSFWVLFGILFLAPYSRVNNFIYFQF